MHFFRGNVFMTFSQNCTVEHKIFATCKFREFAILATFDTQSL